LGRIVQPPATRGSQRWLQELVRDNSSLLDSVVGLGSLEWLSPLAEDDYAEYRDQAFLDRLGVSLDTRPLESFWPAGGPVWDALARTPFGINVLVEAKAHVSEMVSSCAAAAPGSIDMLRAALAETKAAFDVDPEHDWCEGHYQYANRLAHAYLMRELNGIPTELVFIYFIGDSDMGGPASREEWAAALNATHQQLGVFGQLPRYVHDVFLDISGRLTSVST